MKRIVFLYLIGFLVGAHLYGQKDLPVFTLYGECFLNAGKCKDVKIKDNIAYIGTEAGLLIMDVSEPADPNIISCYYTDRFVYKIFIKDTLAFVTSFAMWTPILSIINISNPDNPILINSFETEGYENNSIFVQDNILFLGLSNGLYIYDISDLFNPVIITHLSDIDPMDMVVRDNYIYMVANYRYFGIMDISTITEPELLCWIGDYTTLRSAIDLQGDYAYIAGKTFDIYNITDPANPDQICEFETDYLFDLSVCENFCYSMSDDSLFVMNIEDPTTPVIADYYSYLGSFMSFENNILAVTKDFNYDDPKGIGFFYIDDSQQISLLTEFITDKAKEVFAEGNYAYVSNGYNGLRIINTAIPSNPVTISNCLKGFYVVETIVENNLAYVRTLDGLKIVDVSNPELPFTIGTYNLQSGSVNTSFALEKYDNYVYLGGDWLCEIYVIDISDPYNPLNVGQIDVYDWSPDIEVFDKYLYVAGYWGGMQIFDLADPVNPSMIGYHPLGLALKITAGENMAFVGGAVNSNISGVMIFDLSNINNPFYTGAYEIIGGTDMQCIDNYLLVGKRGYQEINSAIHVVNMSDLNNPVVKQEIMDVAPNGIFYKSGRIYVAEDFKFKIFGDSLTVSTNDIIAYNHDLTLSSFPNPVKGRTTIKFHVKNKGFVQLTVYNSKGELITNLIRDNLTKGLYNVDWNCKNNSGNKVFPGIYIITLRIDNSHVSKKLILTGN
ncbi:MAG: T9SS type A sorting domain-containing protein [Bacteroidales bacterium]|nr:T9SS type A sorting domain-containing protein [Bacteroidales bacterium]